MRKLARYVRSMPKRTSAFPRKQTNSRRLGMSALCQKPTFALQQKVIRLTSRSAQRPARLLGDSEHDEERDRRRRDEIVGWCQVAAGHTDQPSRDEGREPAEYRHRDVVTD